MEHVKIEKDGIWLYRFNKRTQKEERCRPKHVLTMLRDACEIEEGVTLLDIFNGVDALPELKNFIAQYSWCAAIDEFHEQARQPCPPDDEPAMTHLLVSWVAETFTYKGKTDFTMSLDFGGIGPDKTGKVVNWGVSYTPMYRLAHLPVKLDPEVTVYKQAHPDKILFQGERCFSLLEVLDCIYDDISFMGGPKDNEAFMNEAHEVMKEILASEFPPGEDWHDLFDAEEEEKIDPETN
jgi:hypothetical protein